MPSYDKDKLMRLLERKRAAYQRIRDCNERALDARAAANRRRDGLLEQAGAMNARAVVEDLLRLPLQEAARLDRKQVEEYLVQRGDVAVVHKTNISIGHWRDYVAHATKRDRLLGEAAQTRREAEAQFAIIPSLVEAVKKWGFGDPEKELV